MKKLGWSSVFDLGVPEIDTDHRRMVAIINDVREALLAEQYDQAARHIDELLKMSTAHFRREEALLSQLGFPRLAGHVRYHTELLDKAERMRRVCENASGRDEIRDCYDEMLGFLFDDIVRGDYDFKSFLEEKGVAKPRRKENLVARPH